MTMYDSQDATRYTNEYLAQEYRNEAANAKYKLEKLQKENDLWLSLFSMSKFYLLQSFMLTERLHVKTSKQSGSEKLNYYMIA